MPELPEVETIRLFLHQHLIGKEIIKTDISVPKMFHGVPSELKNAVVKNTDRKGKVLTFVLQKQSRTSYLSFHLKLSGQILFASDHTQAVFPNKIPLANSHELPAKTTRMIFHFTDGSLLFFNDLRKFGWAKLSDKPEHPTGVDVLSADFTEEYILNKLPDTKRPIKTVLLDQTIIAGVGNIYANDSLWEAGIHPERPTNSLSEAERKCLYLAIKKIIAEGLKYKGSSAKDELYVLPDSSPGTYQNHFKTYHQHGQKCIRCGSIIQRTKIGGRGTFFCPVCQL